MCSGSPVASPSKASVLVILFMCTYVYHLAYIAVLQASADSQLILNLASYLRSNYYHKIIS